MRFLVSIDGDHAEGHEARYRLDKLAGQFVTDLNAMGFHSVGVLVTHDADSAAETPTETHGDQAAQLSVKFASVEAATLADQFNLTDTDFVGIEPPSNGFLVRFVKSLIRKKGLVPLSPGT